MVQKRTKIRTTPRSREVAKPRGLVLPGGSSTGYMRKEQRSSGGADSPSFPAKHRPRPSQQRVAQDEETQTTHNRESHFLKPRSRAPRSPPSSLSSADSAPAVSPSVAHAREGWQIQKEALQRKFGATGWAPRKRVSPDALEGIRALHATDPAAYTTSVLAQHFAISPEAIRRILRSKWRPSPAEAEDRRRRWEQRGVQKWAAMAEAGIKPPKKWREAGVANPAIERKRRNRERRREGTDEERREDPSLGSKREGKR